MKKDKHKTKIKFLYHEGNKDLFAYFPEVRSSKEFRMSYSHVGQHSDCCEQYVKDSRKAKPKEYMSLKKELENIGYNLQIVK